MTRLILPLVTLVLLVLVLVDRVERVTQAGAAGEVRLGDTVTAPVVGEASAGARTSDRPGAGEPAPAGTPTIDRLARLATRQQLAREGAYTYLDSLILSTDSVIRRWPDRSGSALRFATVAGGTDRYHPRLETIVRDAFDRWEAAHVGVRFIRASDTASADIVVRWMDRFDFDRAGQTDLTWDQLGRVRRASISLALLTSGGLPLPDAALAAVAVHEVGHAIGLPHSSDSADVMFPSTRTGDISRRDQRTASVLYRLPPGPVRDLPTR